MSAAPVTHLGQLARIAKGPQRHAQPSLPELERQLGSGGYFRDPGACAKPLARHVSGDSKSINFRLLEIRQRGLALEMAEIGPDERIICQWFPLTSLAAWLNFGSRRTYGNQLIEQFSGGRRK